MKDALSIAQLNAAFGVAQTVTEIQQLEARADQQGYIYRTVAPIRTVPSIRIDLIKGALKLPVVAKFTDHSASAPRIGRKAVQIGEGRIPATKMAIDITPEDLQNLLMMGSGVLQRAAMANIYTDRATLVNSIPAREEYSLIQAFQTGKVSLTEPAIGSKRGISATLDYQVPANRFKVLEQLWSDAATPIIDQIVTEAELFRDLCGFMPKVMLTPSKQVSNIIRNTQVVKAIAGDANPSKRVTLNDVNAMLLGLGLPVVLPYDRRGEVGDTANASFADETKVVMLDGVATFGPAGVVASIAQYGTTDRGPTMEAISDYIGDDYPWPESALSGIFMRSKLTGSSDGAPNGFTIVSATTAPNLGNIDRIRVMTVAR